MSTNLKEVFCMLEFAAVAGPFHQFTQVPSPKQYGARVKENSDAVQVNIYAICGGCNE